MRPDCRPTINPTLKNASLQKKNRIECNDVYRSLHYDTEFVSIRLAYGGVKETLPPCCFV